MAIKSYRVYISGHVSPRLSQLILHNMSKDLGLVKEEGEVVNADQAPTIRNMHRGNEEAYFDVDIQDVENAASIVDSMKRYIIENLSQYEDITDSPPRNMFDVT